MTNNKCIVLVTRLKKHTSSDALNTSSLFTVLILGFDNKPNTGFLLATRIEPFYKHAVNISSCETS